MKIRDIVVEGKVIVGPWAGSNDAVSAPIEKIARVKNPTASDWIKTPLRAFRSRRLISKYKRLANDAFEKSLEEMEKADRYEWTDSRRFSHEKIYIKYLGLNRYFSMLAGDEEREFNPKAIMHYQGKYPELKQMYDADMQQEINTLTERKRKRKRKTTRTVYGGWWGGYPLDNSSGEGGGEGVAERLNELAPNGFNGGDDGNDLQLYINVAKKLNMKKYKPSTAHDLIAKRMAELVDVVDDDKVDYARHMARKAQGLPNMLDQDVAESTLSWSTLSDSLSVEDKLTIFEEYYSKNTLLESNSESSTKYFKSLFELSDDPVPNKKYIVVPLMLVSDRIMQLDSPSVMKYVGSKNEVLLFTHANVEREYPPTTLRHRSLSHTFTFATRGAYDKFRIALRLKFDVELSNVNKSIDEASSAAQQAAIAISMKRAGKKPKHNK